ncbi:MAG: YbaB/EbfC family nucleoid-associated protein [Proteobacteria bacterium]|nr:YbaB/EbfC family nucleoid-associated protein [Pseudomonadota bacterium]
MSRMPKDMQQLMAQAQQMQQQMMAAQESLAAKTYEGTAGGGAVTVVVKGSGEVLSVAFEPEVLDPDDPEMAGDLVVAALNQAFGAMSADAEGSMGGMDIGGMLG